MFNGQKISSIEIVGPNLNTMYEWYTDGPGQISISVVVLRSTTLSTGTHILPQTCQSAWLFCPNLSNIDEMIAAKSGQTGAYSQDSVLKKLYMASTSGITSAKKAFNRCKVLPANQFPTNWSSLAHGDGMFNDCSLLDAATANDVLDSLPEWTDGSSHVITFTGTAAATSWAEAGADLSHVAAAQAKGWIVEGSPETDNQ